MDMIICIDPGHGMANTKAGVYDPGAVGNGAEEATIVLDYAITLNFILKEAGFRTVLTRSDRRTPVPLRSRVDIARWSGATHLISIHMNAFPRPTANGTETIISQEESRPWARLFQDASLQVFGLRDRGVKSRKGLAILKFPGPAALVELGFITNREDLRAIVPPTANEYRDVRIAWSKEVLRRLQQLTGK